MDKKIAGIVGAITALAIPQAAKAMPAAPDVNQILQVQSYADVLNPIPNAAELLRAVDSQSGDQVSDVQKIQVQYHHHHHHHHHHFRRYHHHHHNFYRHHHHHHHHHIIGRILHHL